MRPHDSLAETSDSRAMLTQMDAAAQAFESGDYEIDEEEWGDKKKPWRYRWSDEVRDEALARLLEVNAQRAKEEARSGAAAAKIGFKKAVANRADKASATGDLFS